jgi:hypothetical protein
MCGGGSGPSADEVADSQWENELKRMAMIKQAVDNINAAFDGYDTTGTMQAIKDSQEYAAILAEQQKRNAAKPPPAPTKGPRRYPFPGRGATNTGYTINQDGSITLADGTVINADGTTATGATNLQTLFGRSKASKGASQAKGPYDALYAGLDADLIEQVKALEAKYKKPNGREAMYADRENAVRQVNTTELNRQSDEAKRNLKFNLARAGLGGGSVDVDSQTELARRYNQGTLKIEEMADQAGADLRMADERTRMSLVGQAQAGLDATQATQLALKNLEANATAANAVGQYQSLGDLMSDLADYYGMSRYMMGRSSGQVVSPYGGGFGASPTSPGSRYQGS